MIGKTAVIGVHGGHAKIGSRGAICYMDEVTEDRKLKKGMLKAFRQRRIYCSRLYGFKGNVTNGLFEKDT